MEKRLKVSGVISLIFGFISFCWLIYNTIAFEYVRPKVIQFEDIGVFDDRLMKIVFLGLLFSFFFHLFAILTIIFQFQFFKKTNMLRIVLMCIGIISLISLFVDWAALGDIGKQYKMGVSTYGEWTFLYSASVLHGLFHILLFILIFITFRELRKQVQIEFAQKDEIIFCTAQYVGILCGIIGLAVTLFLWLIQAPIGILKNILIPYCVFIMIPYCLFVSYWLIIKRKERLKEWYDEKQFRDISKSSLMTLVFSLPCLAIMFLINFLNMSAPANLLWFPFYMFLILLIFSGGTLYFSKKE